MKRSSPRWRVTAPLPSLFHFVTRPSGQAVSIQNINRLQVRSPPRAAPLQQAFVFIFLILCGCSQQDAERTVHAFEELRREYEKLRMQKMDVEELLQSSRQDVQKAQAVNSRLQQDVEVLSECAV
jgi:hypothetical protein